jgi:hypothetical protein
MVKTAGISFHRSCLDKGHPIHWNQRHIDYTQLPERFKDLEKYIILREPHSWYKSFYNFFLTVEGYMSFMTHDLKDDGYIYPIGLNNFILRSINLKETLTKFPNKARVFNNILQSQGPIHFVTSYFERPIDPKDPTSLDQFDMSLFEWFWKHAGGWDADHIVPLKNMSKLERDFNINMMHTNKSKKKTDEEITPHTMKIIKKTHKKFYKLYNQLMDDS